MKRAPFRGLGAILFKEFITVLRDPITLFFMLFPPLVEMIAFGYALDNDVKHMAMAILNEDRTVESRQFLDRFVNTETFRIVAEVQNVEQLASEIRKGRAYVGLQIPPHFTNIQHGLRLARQQLAIQDTLNRQVILITDGLPTAHFEGSELYLLYPPDPRSTVATAARGVVEGALEKSRHGPRRGVPGLAVGAGRPQVRRAQRVDEPSRDHVVLLLEDPARQGRRSVGIDRAPPQGLGENGRSLRHGGPGVRRLNGSRPRQRQDGRQHHGLHLGPPGPPNKNPG